MEKKVILDNEFMTLWYHPDKKIIHHEFHKFTQGETLRDCLSAGAEQMEFKGAQKWLSDDRKNTVVGEDDMKWTSTVWRPRVIKAGWKYWALVLPEKVLGERSMKRLADDMRGFGVEVYLCNDSDQGLKWLKSQG